MESCLEVEPGVKCNLAKVLFLAASQLPDPERKRGDVYAAALAQVKFGEMPDEELEVRIKFVQDRLVRFIKRTPNYFTAQRKAAWWNMLAAAGVTKDEAIILYLLHCPPTLTDGQRAAVVRELVRRGGLSEEKAKARLQGRPRRQLVRNKNGKHRRRCELA